MAFKPQIVKYCVRRLKQTVMSQIDITLILQLKASKSVVALDIVERSNDHWMLAQPTM